MLLIYLGIFTIFAVIAWAIFIVARIHALKFKEYSTMIEKTTSLLFFLLIFLTILGYVLIFLNFSNTGDARKIQVEKVEKSSQEDFSDFNETYY